MRGHELSEQFAFGGDVELAIDGDAVVLHRAARQAHPAGDFDYWMALQGQQNHLSFPLAQWGGDLGGQVVGCGRSRASLSVGRDFVAIAAGRGAEVGWQLGPAQGHMALQMHGAGTAGGDDLQGLGDFGIP